MTVMINLIDVVRAMTAEGMVSCLYLPCHGGTASSYTPTVATREGRVALTVILRLAGVDPAKLAAMSKGRIDYSDDIGIYTDGCLSPGEFIGWLQKYLEANPPPRDEVPIATHM